jgi:uncharacterized protein
MTMTKISGTKISEPASTFKIIDVDTHLLEPPDLWTSRLPKKFVDQAPQVRWDEDQQEEIWVIGDRKLQGVGMSAHGGWSDFFPSHPPRFSEIDPAAYDAKARLAKMDEFGIYAQILYPNVALFHSAGVQSGGGAEFSLACTRTYNDYQTEWCSADPNRLIPITILPFWNLEETLAEIDRCAAAGHRGIVFSQNPSAFELPALIDRHWDPMWAKAQDLGLSVNFHIASGNNSDLPATYGYESSPVGLRAKMVIETTPLFLRNGLTIAELIVGGICHRFPDLNFVSVESGIGWLPFVLDLLDWHWKNYDITREHPEYDLLPSEYFRRQIYGCFWFEEHSALSAIDYFDGDNLMYETDFPHSTSMTPGPGSVARSPGNYLSEVMGEVPEATLRKLVHDTAAKVYHLA